MQSAELEGRAAEAAELLAESLRGERLFLSGREWDGGIQLDDMAVTIVGNEGQRRARAPVDFERDRALKPNLLALKCRAHFAIERGVVGLPDELSTAHPTPVDITVAETQRSFAGAAGLDLVNSATLLTLIGFTGVEDQAVARFQRRRKTKRNGVVFHPRHFAKEDAAFGPEAGVGELLIINPTKPAGEKTAGETHLEFVAGRLRLEFRRRDTREVGHHFIEGLAINPRNAGNVFRRLQATLDLQRGHSDANEVGQNLEAGEVLRAEQITFVAEGNLEAVRDQVVRQTAGLGTFAAVGGASAEGLTRETLAGIRDTEGAMHKHLKRQRTRRVER